ncbi:hypothetical protein G6L85_11550 [Agrobacterium rhizogenes]|uniref:hypothetical protein n=1 Tax=Rhizobium rhizogenes TaxID=359 RepID=UPI001574405A|nr:hypothetical protein [Rhizobium rhizogenes]NTI62139.1 hypothetical protein [Rhizobium rhizogenes]
MSADPLLNMISAYEIENFNACIDAHRSALTRFAVVADPVDASEEERQAADDAETAAFKLNMSSITLGRTASAWNWMLISSKPCSLL